MRCDVVAFFKIPLDNKVDVAFYHKRQLITTKRIGGKRRRGAVRRGREGGGWRKQ